MHDRSTLTRLTAEIVISYFTANSLAHGEIPTLIESIQAAFDELTAEPAAEQPALAPRTPARIRKSITPDALISFEDGKRYRRLTPHLRSRGLTAAEYREKWGLPADRAVRLSRPKQAPPPPP
jgi:predicted transcriptional regulator